MRGGRREEEKELGFFDPQVLTGLQSSNSGATRQQCGDYPESRTMALYMVVSKREPRVVVVSIKLKRWLSVI